MVKKVFRFVAVIAAVVWFLVDALWSRYYKDVTECFTPSPITATPRFLTIHHDGVDRPTTCDEINRYHRDTCEMEYGIAYHYVVMPDRIYKIRDERQRGTHVKNGNTGNIGICVHGDFNKSRPTLTQQILLICLVNKLCWEYDIPKQNIKGHGDWAGNNTSCPGKNFDLKQMLKYIYTKE